MHVPLQEPKVGQLDLLEPVSEPDTAIHAVASVPGRNQPRRVPEASASRSATASTGSNGRPLQLPVSLLYEDPDNPRTDTIESRLEDLAQDIQERGVLQPIVVHPADSTGRYPIHFGARRLRAARQAGLSMVPVVVRDAAPDPYAQVAENLVRRALSPLELARFIKSRVDAGESNVTIGKRIGMNLTSVAHHLTLLELPAALDQLMQSGRCTSPRTLHEVAKLQDATPDEVGALVASDREITRASVSALRRAAPVQSQVPSTSLRPSAARLAQAEAACIRLEKVLDGTRGASLCDADRAALHRRLLDIASRLESNKV